MSGVAGMGDEIKPECREVLTEVYLYLDLECSETRRDMIRVHLDECSPCLREFGIEQEVKQLVARCCGAEKAPEALRQRLRAKLADLVVDAESHELLAE
jgi:mycothiol system anti-sigma-R factor